MTPRYLIDGPTAVEISPRAVVLNRTHPSNACAGEHCVIHNPSDHPMREFNLHWRQRNRPFDVGLPIMERLCPHGVGHPDPDHIAAVEKLHGTATAIAESVHGCDGCCRGVTYPTEEKS